MKNKCAYAPNYYSCNRRCQNKPIAMAYVPMQQWSTLYEPCKALYAGTAFPELDLIFCGRRCR